MPLTNYNVFVLDQTLKNNSSISLVNTNVWRSGNDYDANVTSALFDLNNKKNSWNVGGNVSFSNVIGANNKTITGYAHSIYLGKTSGRFTFNVWQDLTNDKYDKSDLGYFTNNNTMDQGLWAGYNWNKPGKWYNQLRINTNFWVSRLVSPIDNLRRKSMMFQGAGINFNANAQTKKLWWLGLNINGGPGGNDFYEPRSYGRVFRNKGRIGLNAYVESNSAKRFSWSGNLFAGTGSVFKRTSLEYSLSGKARFNSKFSVDYTVFISNTKNQPGWASQETNTSGEQVIYFSRRDVRNVENVLSLKYSFTNRMGFTMRTRHSWTKVDPKEFYELDKFGDLQPLTTTFTKNVNQNFNFLSVDMVYNWQFAQGSFFSIVWKDFGESFSRQFERDYVTNLGKTIDGSHYNSLSVKVIYFIDYLTARQKLSKKKSV